MLLLIPAGTEDEARAYFTGLLGMPEIPKPPVLAVRGGCWFQAGDQQLHVGSEPTFTPATRAHPALVTAKFDELRLRLEASGYELTPGAQVDGRQQWFTTDPFGNRIEIVTH